jgi:hypothetical protein
VRAAVSAPLASDGLAASLLSHKDPSIISQVLAALHRADLDALAENYEQTGSESGYWSAARLRHSIGTVGAGLNYEYKCGCLLKTLENLTHIRAISQPGALSLKISCQSKLMLLNHTDANLAIEMVATAKLDAKLYPDDTAALYQSKRYVALLQFGMLQGPYSLTVRWQW